MICPKCGAVFPDGSILCGKCGSILTKPIQSTVPPVQNNFNAGQPVYGQQSAQPMPPAQNVPPFQNNLTSAQPIYGQQPSQPMQQGQFGGLQPQAASMYAQQGAPKKKSKVVPIVVASLVVVATVLVILFVEIIPRLGGLERKMKHKWSLVNDEGVTVTYDFKENTITDSASFDVETFSWSLSDDRVTVNRSSISEPLVFVVAISDSGKSMTWTSPYNASDYVVFTRRD